MRMRYIPYILIMLLVLAGGLLTGAVLFGGPDDPAAQTKAVIWRTTTTVPLAARVAALEKRVAALEASTTTTLATTTTTVAPTTTTKPPTTTTAKPTTTTTVAPTTTTTAPSGALSVKDYGAKADGVNDDRAAIQTCINAAAAAGKEVYFPAGTYRMIPSGGRAFVIPSNVVLRGEGTSSVLEIYDNGTDQQPVGLYINDKSNITIKDLKLAGTVTAGTSYPSQYPSVQAITVDAGVGGLTVRGVTFDKCEYAIKFQDYTGASSSNVVFDSCTTLSSVMNPFFVARVEDFRVTGGYYAAATVGQRSGRWPHHFYLANGVKEALIDGCTLTGGQHAWTTSEPAVGESIVFRDITLRDIYQGSWDTSTEGSLLYDGITLVAPARSKTSEAWFTFSGSGSIEVRDFDITCAPGRGQYLVTDYGATVHCRNGIIRNSAGLSAIPPGAYIEGGQVIYEHVTVE